MATGSKHTTASEELQYASGGLKRETGWWGAFVIGLAGTILVTGIAPVMVTQLGASGVPVTVFITLTGWLLCLILAELAAMMPERTGGSPSYAYPAYKDRWPRFAKHINGFTAWAYWLGWFPVAPLNMILASFYLADRFHLNTTAGFTPINTFIAWSTLIIAIAGLLLFFIPAYRGIRFGANFATVLALLSMIPLTFIAIAWIFNPSVVNLGELSGFPRLDGSSFFSDMSGYKWLQVYIAYGFLLTWNVIAMEAAACYIGECANPDQDAKIAMNLEGAYGVFIYALIPQCHSRLWPSSLSDGTRWRVPHLLCEDQRAWRAGASHGLQRRRIPHYRFAGRCGGNLQFLQCRLHRVLPAGADRLLLATPGQAASQATLQAPGVHEIRRLGVSGDFFRLLALRRPLVLEDRQCPDLLLAWLGDAARLPASLLVSGLRRRQAGARGRKQAQTCLSWSSDGRQLGARPPRRHGHACLT